LSLPVRIIFAEYINQRNEYKGGIKWREIKQIRHEIKSDELNYSDAFKTAKMPLISSENKEYRINSDGLNIARLKNGDDANSFGRPNVAHMLDFRGKIASSFGCMMNWVSEMSVRTLI
jgi:hypothetical protein